MFSMFLCSHSNTTASFSIQQLHCFRRRTVDNPSTPGQPPGSRKAEPSQAQNKNASKVTKQRHCSKRQTTPRPTANGRAPMQGAVAPPITPAPAGPQRTQNGIRRQGCKCRPLTCSPRPEWRRAQQSQSPSVRSGGIHTTQGEQGGHSLHRKKTAATSNATTKPANIQYGH